MPNDTLRDEQRKRIEEWVASRSRSARNNGAWKMRWKVRSADPHFLVIVSVSVKPGEHLQQPVTMASRIGSASYF